MNILKHLDSMKRGRDRKKIKKEREEKGELDWASSQT